MGKAFVLLVLKEGKTTSTFVFKTKREAVATARMFAAAGLDTKVERMDD